MTSLKRRRVDDEIASFVCINPASTEVEDFRPLSPVKVSSLMTIVPILGEDCTICLENHEDAGSMPFTCFECGFMCCTNCASKITTGSCPLCRSKAKTEWKDRLIQLRVLMGRENSNKRSVYTAFAMYYYIHGQAETALRMFYTAAKLGSTLSMYYLSVGLEAKSARSSEAKVYLMNLSVEAGYKCAVERLADAYEHGRFGLAVDKQAAILYYTIASAHPDASPGEFLLPLGSLYSEVNSPRAITCLRAVDSPEAWVKLGLFYSQLRPSAVRAKEAFSLFEKAASAGYTRGVRMTARCLIHGEGTPIDEPLGYDMLKRLFLGDKNSLSASECVGLGVYCYNNRQHDIAYDAFCIAADRGRSTAMFYVGLYLLTGLGVKADPKTAVEYLKNASGTCMAAVHLLYRCYTQGKGVEKDDAVAKQYLDKGVADHYPDSVCALARAYEHGLLGLAVDLNEAFRLHVSLSGSNCLRADIALGRFITSHPEMYARCGFERTKKFLLACSFISTDRQKGLGMLRQCELPAAKHYLTELE